MKPRLILCLALVLSGGLFGCSTTLNHPAGLPLSYHNTQYDFTFFLPASWQRYSVSAEPLNVSLSSTNYANEIETERLQIITIRNPQWTTNNPYKDIWIMAYTRKQWDEERQDRLNTHAGGMIDELWHNQKYVFGLPSRYYEVENDNNGKELKGVEEAADIIERNCAAHKMPHLYPE